MREREREPLVGFFSKGFFSGRTFTQGLKITGKKHVGNLGVGESIAQKAAPWCFVINPALYIKCKPWGLVLKKILPSWQVGCFSRPCQDSFALFYEDWLSMTVRNHGHHCTQLRLGVVSTVRRDGRPPTLIRVGPRTEKHKGRERYNLR